MGFADQRPACCVTGRVILYCDGITLFTKALRSRFWLASCAVATAWARMVARSAEAVSAGATREDTASAYGFSLRAAATACVFTSARLLADTGACTPS